MIIISGTLNECLAYLQEAVKCSEDLDEVANLPEPKVWFRKSARGPRQPPMTGSDNTSILERSGQDQAHMQPCDDCDGIIGQEGYLICSSQARCPYEEFTESSDQDKNIPESCRSSIVVDPTKLQAILGQYGLGPEEIAEIIGEMV